MVKRKVTCVTSPRKRKSNGVVSGNESKVCKLEEEELQFDDTDDIVASIEVILLTCKYCPRAFPTKQQFTNHIYKCPERPRHSQSGPQVQNKIVIHQDINLSTVGNDPTKIDIKQNFILNDQSDVSGLLANNFSSPFKFTISGSQFRDGSDFSVLVKDQRDSSDEDRKLNEIAERLQRNSVIITKTVTTNKDGPIVSDKEESKTYLTQLGLGLGTKDLRPSSLKTDRVNRAIANSPLESCQEYKSNVTNFLESTCSLEPSLKELCATIDSTVKREKLYNSMKLEELSVQNYIPTVKEVLNASEALSEPKYQPVKSVEKPSEVFKKLPTRLLRSSLKPVFANLSNSVENATPPKPTSYERDYHLKGKIAGHCTTNVDQSMDSRVEGEPSERYSTEHRLRNYVPFDVDNECDTNGTVAELGKETKICLVAKNEPLLHIEVKSDKKSTLQQSTQKLRENLPDMSKSTEESKGPGTLTVLETDGGNIQQIQESTTEDRLVQTVDISKQIDKCKTETKESFVACHVSSKRSRSLMVTSSKINHSKYQAQSLHQSTEASDNLLAQECPEPNVIEANDLIGPIDNAPSKATRTLKLKSIDTDNKVFELDHSTETHSEASSCLWSNSKESEPNKAMSKVRLRNRPSESRRMSRFRSSDVSGYEGQTKPILEGSCSPAKPTETAEVTNEDFTKKQVWKSKNSSALIPRHKGQKVAMEQKHTVQNETEVSDELLMLNQEKKTEQHLKTSLGKQLRVLRRTSTSILLKKEERPFEQRDVDQTESVLLKTVPVQNVKESAPAKEESSEERNDPVYNQPFEEVDFNQTQPVQQPKVAGANCTRRWKILSKVRQKDSGKKAFGKEVPTVTEQSKANEELLIQNEKIKKDNNKIQQSENKPKELPKCASKEEDKGNLDVQATSEKLKELPQCALEKKEGNVIVQTSFKEPKDLLQCVQEVTVRQLRKSSRRKSELIQPEKGNVNQGEQNMLGGEKEEIGNANVRAPSRERKYLPQCALEEEEGNRKVQTPFKEPKNLPQCALQETAKEVRRSTRRTSELFQPEKGNIDHCEQKNLEGGEEGSKENIIVQAPPEESTYLSQCALKEENQNNHEVHSPLHESKDLPQCALEGTPRQQRKSSRRTSKLVTLRKENNDLGEQKEQEETSNVNTQATSKEATALPYCAEEEDEDKDSLKVQATLKESKDLLQCALEGTPRLLRKSSRRTSKLVTLRKENNDLGEQKEQEETSNVNTQATSKEATALPHCAEEEDEDKVSLKVQATLKESKDLLQCALEGTPRLLRKSSRRTSKLVTLRKENNDHGEQKEQEETSNVNTQATSKEATALPHCAEEEDEGKDSLKVQATLKESKDLLQCALEGTPRLLRKSSRRTSKLIGPSKENIIHGEQATLKQASQHLKCMTDSTEVLVTSDSLGEEDIKITKKTTTDLHGHPNVIGRRKSKTFSIEKEVEINNPVDQNVNVVTLITPERTLKAAENTSKKIKKFHGKTRTSPSTSHMSSISANTRRLAIRRILEETRKLLRLNTKTFEESRLHVSQSQTTELQTSVPGNKPCTKYVLDTSLIVSGISDRDKANSENHVEPKLHLTTKQVETGCSIPKVRLVNQEDQKSQLIQQLLLQTKRRLAMLHWKPNKKKHNQKINPTGSASAIRTKILTAQHRKMRFKQGKRPSEQCFRLKRRSLKSPSTVLSLKNSSEETNNLLEIENEDQKTKQSEVILQVDQTELQLPKEPSLESVGLPSQEKNKTSAEKGQHPNKTKRNKMSTNTTGRRIKRNRRPLLPIVVLERMVLQNIFKPASLGKRIERTKLVKRPSLSSARALRKRKNVHMQSTHVLRVTQNPLDDQALVVLEVTEENPQPLKGLTDASKQIPKSAKVLQARLSQSIETISENPCGALVDIKKSAKKRNQPTKSRLARVLHGRASVVPKAQSLDPDTDPYRFTDSPEPFEHDSKFYIRPVPRRVFNVPKVDESLISDDLRKVTNKPTKRVRQQSRLIQLNKQQSAQAAQLPEDISESSRIVTKISCEPPIRRVEKTTPRKFTGQNMEREADIRKNKEVHIPFKTLKQSVEVSEGYNTDLCASTVVAELSGEFDLADPIQNGCTDKKETKKSALRRRKSSALLPVKEVHGEETEMKPKSCKELSKGANSQSVRNVAVVEKGTVTKKEKRVPVGGNPPNQRKEHTQQIEQTSELVQDLSIMAKPEHSMTLSEIPGTSLELPESLMGPNEANPQPTFSAVAKEETPDDRSVLESSRGPSYLSRQSSSQTTALLGSQLPKDILPEHQSISTQSLTHRSPRFPLKCDEKSTKFKSNKQKRNVPKQDIDSEVTYTHKLKATVGLPKAIIAVELVNKLQNQCDTLFTPPIYPSTTEETEKPLEASNTTSLNEMFGNTSAFDLIKKLVQGKAKELFSRKALWSDDDPPGESLRQGKDLLQSKEKSKQVTKNSSQGKTAKKIPQATISPTLVSSESATKVVHQALQLVEDPTAIIETIKQSQFPKVLLVDFLRTGLVKSSSCPRKKRGKASPPSKTLTNLESLEDLVASNIESVAVYQSKIPSETEPSGLLLAESSSKLNADMPRSSAGFQTPAKSESSEDRIAATIESVITTHCQVTLESSPSQTESRDAGKILSLKPEVQKKSEFSEDLVGATIEYVVSCQSQIPPMSSPLSKSESSRAQPGPSPPTAESPESPASGSLPSQNSPETLVSCSKVDPHIYSPSDLTCKDCRNVFSDYVDLMRHVRAIHSYPKILMAPSELQKFHDIKDRTKCPICHKPLKNNFVSSFIKHLSTHTTEMKYTCNVCSRQFRRKDHKAAHEKRHGSIVDMGQEPLTD